MSGAASAAPRSPRSALVRLLTDAARVDRSSNGPRVALRNAVGIAAPLAIALSTGAVSAGLPSTVGAIQAAFADRPGPYRLRVLRMLTTSAAAAITSGLATWISPHTAASAAFLFLLAAGAGVLLSGGPAAAQTGTAATAAAVVLGHIPQSFSGAVHIAELVLLGGVGQTVLAVAAWPLRRHRPEREALAGLYSQLAAAARTPRGPDAEPPAAAAVDTVRATLYGLGHDSGSSVEAYRVLLDEAERIRGELVGLAALVQRLDSEDDPISAGLLRASLSGAADVLDAVAEALHQGRRVDVLALEPARSAARQADDRLREPGSPQLTRRAAVARLAAFTGQLRAVVETASTGAREGAPKPPDLPGRSSLRDPVAILRANLNPDSAVIRHALRLAVLVSASDLVVRLLGVQRGYWVPLTALVVLRPDFGSTLQRAFLRVIGTVLGLLLATGLLHLLDIANAPGADWYLIALIVVFGFGTRLAGPNNFGITAVALSGLVVVLLEISGVPARETVLDRSVATLVGGALALIAVLVWPTWEREFLLARLADLLAAYRDLARVLADPASDRPHRQAARAAARRARTNALASLTRARAEPVPATAQIDLGESVVASSHRVAHALMTVSAVRGRIREAGGCGELDELLHRAADHLDGCVEALRGGGVPPRAVGSLREDYDRLAAILQADPGRAAGPEEAAALLDACDRLTNAVDTLVDAVRQRRDQPGGSRRTDSGSAISVDRSGAGRGSP